MSNMQSIEHKNLIFCKSKPLELCSSPISCLQGINSPRKAQLQKHEEQPTTTQPRHLRFVAPACLQNSTCLQFYLICAVSPHFVMFLNGNPDEMVGFWMVLMWKRMDVQHLCIRNPWHTTDFWGSFQGVRQLQQNPDQLKQLPQERHENPPEFQHTFFFNSPSDTYII